MKNEQLAEQALLASEILKTGHPWELKNSNEWRAGIFPHEQPIWCIANGFEIRLALATPGNGRKLHNPDNLTAEQVGAGWRLALPDEQLLSRYDYWIFSGGWSKGGLSGMARLARLVNPGASMRVPLSTPWPEAPKPNPAFTLPTPPPGMRWHREDGWKEGDLPQGWRPVG